MSSNAILVPINEQEYEIWSAESKRQYTAENIKNGLTEDEALHKTEEDFKRLLPDGRKTFNQFIFSIKEEDLCVGTLWYGVIGAVNNRRAFIYDIVLHESARGKGHGKKAMQLLEEEVKKEGYDKIGLHVFGHNKIARELYASLGYEITNLHMQKKI